MIKGVLALVLALVSSGCGFRQDCWDLLQCDESPVMAEPPPTCDPAVGGIQEACPGIYVSSTRGDDSSPGTETEPVRTLGHALRLAQMGPRRVYACGESFAEAVEIAAGVELWGGLDCTGDGWGYLGETQKTEIIAEPGAITARIVEGTGRAILADVHIEAADAVQPSGSSIAVSVASRAAVDIVRSELVAGRGAPGAPGRTGGDLPARAGEAGALGAAACSSSTVQGGEGAVNACDNGTSAGGRGGAGGTSQGAKGVDGSPAPIPNPAGWGLGGAGVGNSSICFPGAAGANGASGQHGLGGRGPGSFSVEGWMGVSGEDGGDGLPGQGGGGGGGSRAGVMFCGAALGGASGGGGGAGGCGGSAGKGGGYGGASIGLLTLSGDVMIRASSIATRGGGDGGDGGRGQIGGVPGLAGAAGSPLNMSPAACVGGDGGAGGDGGHGGGGLGGPSIAVLFYDGHIPLIDGLDMTTGPAGKGGLGGDPSFPYGIAEDGLRMDTLGFPPP